MPSLLGMTCWIYAPLFIVTDRFKAEFDNNEKMKFMNFWIILAIIGLIYAIIKNIKEEKVSLKEKPKKKFELGELNNKIGEFKIDHLNLWEMKTLTIYYAISLGMVAYIKILGASDSESANYAIIAMICVFVAYIFIGCPIAALIAFGKSERRGGKILKMILFHGNMVLLFKRYMINIKSMVKTKSYQINEMLKIV